MSGVNEANCLLALEYFKAQVTGAWNRQHPLHLPISQCGFFDMLAARRAKKIRPLSRRKFEQKRFVRHLTVPTGDPVELQGQVILNLHRLQSWFDDWSQPKMPGFISELGFKEMGFLKMRPSRDFKTIADTYAQRLGIPRTVFSRIWGVYVRLTISETLREHEPLKQTVFWAARLTDVLDRGRYDRYIGRITAFYQTIFQQIVQRGGKAGLPAQLRPAVEALRETLYTDPLFNCTFHSKVFRGHKKLQYHKSNDLSTRDVMAQLIVYAIQKFREFESAYAGKTLGTVLSDLSFNSSAVRKTIKIFAGKGGSFAFIAPFLQAICSNGTGYTIDNLKVTYHRKKDEVNVDKLDAHLRKTPYPI